MFFQLQVPVGVSCKLFVEKLASGATFPFCSARERLTQLFSVVENKLHDSDKVFQYVSQTLGVERRGTITVVGCLFGA